jgi:CRP/FNR family transcriptional regulator, cyclic AMP receptor protein
MPALAASVQTLLQASPLFQELSTEEREELGALVEPFQLHPGETLFEEGAQGHGMWILGPGARVSVWRKGGAEPLAVLQAGQTVGEMALVDDGARSGAALIDEGAPALFLDVRRFNAALDAFRPAAFKLLRALCKDLCARLRSTNDRVVAPTRTKLPPQAPAHTLRRCPPDLLATCSPFHTLPATVRLALAQKLSLLEVSAVTPVFAEGDVADAAYFVVKGQVSVGRNGRTLATLGVGGMVGLVACIDEGYRSASVVTSGSASLLRLGDGDFDALFAASNRFAYQLVRLIAHQLVGFIRNTNSLIDARETGRKVTKASLAPSVPPEDLPEIELLPVDMELNVTEADEPLV